MIELDKEYQENVVKRLEEEADDHLKSIIDGEIHQSDS
jgi:hypothetical protein